MPTWHRFNVDGTRDPQVAWWWPADVEPGDVEQVYGTQAYMLRDFVGRTDETPGLFLHSAPILILSVHAGIPGELTPSSAVRTYVALSRHGLIVIVQSRTGSFK